MLAVVAPPGFHTYVVPPDAVNVVLLPLQIVNEGAAEMVSEGTALTETVCEVVPEHPLAVPVRVYPVAVVGFTVMLAVVAPPGFHA
jgi:hypothetical protein